MVLVAIIIAGMILATIAVAALVLAPRVAPQTLVYDVRPDTPPPFGYRMTWLAIRTRDTARVIDALEISKVETANWNTGLGTVYSKKHGQGALFVSPPVNGWTLVAGLALPQVLGHGFADKAMPLLVDLGATFIEVQYFSSCPDVDYFAWARVVDGKLVRAFAIGDEGILWNRGKPTKEEKAMGLRLFEVRGTRGKRGNLADEAVIYPTEPHVMRLASKWSLDPTRIDQLGAPPSVGKIGMAPAAWRPERLRRAA